MLVLVMPVLVGARHAAAQPLENCAAVALADKALDEGMKGLIGAYPGTLAFYGFSTFMLKESNPKKLEDLIAGVTAALIGCAILIDTKSCDFVAGRLITLFSARAAMCVADKNMGCGVCK